MRLIDAGALSEKIDEALEDRSKNAGLVKNVRMIILFEFAKEVIATADTVDAVPVVRCKDCVHGIEKDGLIKCVASADYDDMSNDWFGFVSWHEQEWFCADGERKGGDE